MARVVVAPATGTKRARLERFGVLFERQRNWWALGGCLLIALWLRAPYLSQPLGRDEGGISYLASHWHGGHGALYGSLYGDYWLDRPPLLVGLFKIAVLGGDTGVRVLGAVAAVVLVVTISQIGRALAGARAGWIAGLLAALLTGSISIGAVWTPGELLAAVPSTLSVLCLVLAHRSRRTRLVFAAGALAVGAALVKQSFLDAGAAGAAFVVASAVVDRDVRIRWPLAYAAGAAAPLVLVLIWLAAVGGTVGEFLYTLFGFRLDLLNTLAESSIPLRVRLEQLREPAWDSGLTLTLAAALAGIVHLRRDRVLMVTFGVWLAAATVGVLGGGSYFAHYLIELVPVSSVAAAVVLAHARLPLRVAAVAAITFVALGAVREGTDYLEQYTIHRRERAIGHYIRDHARPGDTQYVMYARANVVYYAGLRQPYPYLWSLMVRVRPGAVTQLRDLLESSRRPTWLVPWQAAERWDLDPDGTLGRVLARRYRLAAVVCSYPILVRSDYRAPPPMTVGSCPRRMP